ncbi:YkgJ family cysteine cluster protein [Deinococcus sp. KSM4-11]|uniref:YkgJ family cysteine cluster protein n=1 Tax=Deinococcus sp. KSM4-11 TaxID=2568654 RepID=UPI0010A40D34|nr:YkgJ family cysteine cluster protein [Deinococcus sp. KSM4-11]THF88304.1 YkgJ family cysteine cluster protein [Deinococcus sp. KSM4-11]
MTTTPPGRHDTVTRPVIRAYARYGRRAGEWLAGYAARGGRVYCAAGCSGCCNMPVRVSLAEALVTRDALIPAQLVGMAEHARAVIANARTAPSDEAYVLTHRTEVGFCPLLDRATGACTAYEVRPTRCRDTFSAFPAVYCAVGTLEAMTDRERAQYHREVARTPGTDGEWHFIAPLEHLSEPVWTAAARAMQDSWGLQVWGDFWVLTTLAGDAAFMNAVGSGEARIAWNAAKQRGLAHATVLEIG